MIAALAHHTLRECQRRAFPWVTVLALGLLTLASLLFLLFSFGSLELEATNLAISAVFLAGLLHAAFLGTSLVRADLERGTLDLLRSQPPTLGAYLTGRYVGCVAAALLLCAAVAAVVGALLLLPLAGTAAPVLGAPLLAGWLRALLAVLVLEAAALAASALAARLLAPVLLGALFVGGTLSEGWLLPDFSLYALEAGPAPPWVEMLAYTACYVVGFLLVAHLALSFRTPLARQS